MAQLLEWLCRNGRHLERWRGEGKHGENKLRVALAREARKYARKEHDVRTGGPEDNGYKTEQIEEILRYLLTHDDWSEIGHQDSSGVVLASLSDASAGFHSLRKEDRRLLSLRYGDDLTLREVGEQVGCSEDAARMRVGRVLERLRSRMAGDAISGLSKGGMKTKVMAAKTAVAGGCAMAIMEGSVLRPLKALAEGAARTWFVAGADPQVARKRWINAMKTRGQIVVDAGAVTALRAGKSLLPAGVRSVSGTFGRGDPVAIVGPDGAVLGKGLIRYTADEAKKIAGHKSGEIEAILGYAGRAALIHRDDMVV